MKLIANLTRIFAVGTKQILTASALPLIAVLVILAYGAFGCTYPRLWQAGDSQCMDLFMDKYWVIVMMCFYGTVCAVVVGLACALGYGVLSAITLILGAFNKGGDH